MKKDVIISITGINRLDGDKDVVELTTVGRYFKKNQDYYIVYDEMQQENMDKTTKTTLRIEEEGRVTMTRSGGQRSQFIIENGKRHQCYYDTGYDAWTVGVLGNRIRSNLTDDGGDLELKYSLDINAMLASENEVYINVKECQK